MRTLISALVAATALALPAAAIAHHGHGTSSAALFERGTGTVTNPGTPNCQHTPGVCVVTAQGTITGRPIAAGTFSSTWTIDWAHATSNGHGGFCAPTTGTTVLTDTATPANTITKTEQGKVCEVGATGTNVEHVGFGTYTITATTGTLATFTGQSGKFWFDQKPSGAVRAVEFSRSGGVLGAHHTQQHGDHQSDHHGGGGQHDGGND